MIQLNGENGQKAWDDYKRFLLGMGQNINLELIPKHQVEQAFKMGFAMGEASKTEPQPGVVVKLDGEPIAAPRKKKPYKRGRIRTPQEIEQDGKLIASILQRHGKPMQLQDIIAAVNTAGANWPANSASGFMIRVMDRYPTIKKVGYGVYGYEQ